MAPRRSSNGRRIRESWIMPDTMTFGLFSMNMEACSYPAGAARIARLAEAAGFDSLWAGESR